MSRNFSHSPPFEVHSLLHLENQLHLRTGTCRSELNNVQLEPVPDLTGISFDSVASH